MDIVELAQLAIAAFTALVGFPALLSTALTLAEYFGLVSAETAGKVNFWANVAAFGGIFIAAALGQVDIVKGLDVLFGNLAQLIAYILVILGIPVGFVITNVGRSLLRQSAFFAQRLN
jgi:hypothetical protein